MIFLFYNNFALFILIYNTMQIKISYKQSIIILFALILVISYLTVSQGIKYATLSAT